ncbi:Tripeptidyl-peptidase 2 [Gracilariopsis chorda]|uniref:tripeptidyl-peptidase II n=1 Tax=Gracilariopsis chorda TaxID=448386 RepID=A0A2V3INF2_9FLOR|nr:Tripeptidyl-peptidase 2 [Gracilariopsis chorda]|eukprot:PXF42650.1 Tripeptidyl-peptidase 2 [Gracilariopsis chorda]
MPQHHPLAHASPRSSSLIPKHVTRVAHLIQSSGSDGTGITVAVLDTGVDPGAPGLSHTTANHRKVVDIVDCTASGDVVTTTSVTLNPSENVIHALSGRMLSIPERILALNPSRNFRLGLKQGYELFPSTLIARLRKERRAVWDKHIRSALNAVRQQLYQHREQKDPHPSVEELEARQAVLLSMDKAYHDYGPLYDVLAFNDGTRWRVVVDTTETGNLRQCDVLEDYAVHGSYSQFGGGIMMNFGVNVYNDGNLVSIVVDGGSHGTHVAGILAAHFPDAPHLNGLAPGAKIVSLKIGDSRLSSMETHQGAMRALAYVLNHSTPVQPDRKPEQTEDSAANDAANNTHSPSDSRDSEPAVTAPDPSQNIVEQDRIRIDVCNMSFGEHSRDINQGRFVQLVEKLVYKHNVLFLSSAGNEGPGLSSVSAPGGTTDAIIGVGAYVTPSMLTQAYSLLHSEFGDGAMPPNRAQNDSDHREVVASSDKAFANEPDPVVAMPYTWSSRGLSWDGAMGVSVCSPGGAIAPVPLWMLQKKTLLNGTSMSSPSAAGAVAVVLSYLRSKGIPYTSSLVRRALENTARPLRSPSYDLDPKAKLTTTTTSRNEEPKSKFDSDYYRDTVFAAGHGSVDALAACQYIEKYMSSRRIVDDSNVAGTFRHRTRAAEAVATSLLEVSDSAVEKRLEKNSPNGPSPDESDKYYHTHENCGDSSLFLEDWRIRITVEDGSPARKSSNNPGFGALNATRGIFLRGESQTCSVHRASVAIEIVRCDDESEDAKRALADMEVTISLQCEASWVEVPQTVEVLGGGRYFSACIDPTSLTPGRAHFAEILGYVQQTRGRKVCGGPVFRVPVAVHKPEPLVDGIMASPLRDLTFSSGSVIRRFYDAPIGSTFALLRVSTGALVLTRDTNEHGMESNVRDRHTEVASSMEFSDLSSTQVQAGEGSGFTLVKSHRVSSKEQKPESNSDKMRSSEKKTIGNPIDKLHPKRLLLRRARGGVDARSFEIHVVQLGPRLHCGELESRQLCTLRPGMVKEFTLKVQGGCTLELCLAQLWSSPGNSVIESVELAFGGLSPKPSTLTGFSGSSCFPRVEVTNYLPTSAPQGQGAGYVSGYTPRGSLNRIQRTVTPSASKIKALEQRDMLPDEGVVFQLQLDYGFEVFDSSAKVSLLFPGLNGAVYEAEVEGGPYVTVHDRNKQFLYASDIYPREQTLVKGEYRATAYLRHERVDLLERLRDLTVTVQYEMPSGVSLDAYDSSHGACLSLDKRRSSRSVTTLECGERRAFYFAAPKRSSLPKWVAVGDMAVGSMWVDKVLSASSSGSRRGNYTPSYPVSYFIGPSISSSSKNDSVSSREKSKSKSAADSVNKSDDDAVTQADGTESNPSRSNDDPDKWFDDAARKLRLKRLRSLLKDGKFDCFDAIFHSLPEKCSEDVEFIMANLERHDVEAAKMHRTEGVTSTFREKVTRIVEITDAVSSNLDPFSVATHFGMLIDTENSEDVSRRKLFEVKRAQLIEAAFRKVRALCLRTAACHPTVLEGMPPTSDQTAGVNGEHHEGTESDRSDSEDDTLEQAFKELARWVTLDGKSTMPGSSSRSDMCDGSITSEDLAFLGARREVRRGRPGFALRVLDNYYGSGSSRKIEAQAVLGFRETLFRQLGWTYLADKERSYAKVRYPLRPAPF